MIAIDPSGLGTTLLWLVTFLFALASGLIPFVFNTELYLLGVAALTDASPVVIVALMTTGQMLGKLVVYLAGRGSLKLEWVRRQASSRAAAAFARRPANAWGVLAVSAVVGVPPFFAVSFLAGTLRMPVAAFLTIGAAGRVVRFTAVFLVPAVFR